jgi:iron complex transport system substrate-binding protein
MAIDIGRLFLRALAALALSAVFGAAVFAAPINLTDDRGKRVQLDAPARRIVSLLPSLTETVCALDACDRLVGVDRYSNWPASVKALPSLGGIEDAPLERIVALKPDLVLIAESARAVDRLEALGLKVLALEPRSHADAQRVFGTVAAALGSEGAGAVLWQRITQRIAAAKQRLAVGWQGQRVYFEVGSGPYAASEASFIGETIAGLGLANVVPASYGPFPKLNPEFVVRADPDLLITTRTGLAEMPQRPGWAGLRALRQGRQCGFSTDEFDVLVRPGPRMGDAADLIADCLAALRRTLP